MKSFGVFPEFYGNVWTGDLLFEKFYEISFKKHVALRNQNNTISILFEIVLVNNFTNLKSCQITQNDKIPETNFPNDRWKFPQRPLKIESSKNIFF